MIYNIIYLCVSIYIYMYIYKIKEKEIITLRRIREVAWEWFEGGVGRGCMEEMENGSNVMIKI